MVANLGSGAPRHPLLDCRETVKDLSKVLGPRYSASRCGLKTFDLYHLDQKPVLARLQALEPKLVEFVQRGQGLIFLGSVGTGKDHLMASMLHAAAEAGLRCSWVNGQEIFGQFRDRIDTGQRDEDYFRQLTLPAVLGISDPIPPVGSPSAWDINNLYRLVDRRYCACKSTWISLNAESTDEADRKLSEPVFDRLRESAEIFNCFWPSYRERKTP